MCDKMSYPFPNFNGEAVDDWNFKSNFTAHFIIYVIVVHAGMDVKPCH